MVIDLRIGCRLENLKKDIDLRIGRQIENLKKDIDLRYRCLSLTYIRHDNSSSPRCTSLDSNLLEIKCVCPTLHYDGFYYLGTLSWNS